MKARSWIFISVGIAALLMAGCGNEEQPVSPEKTAQQEPEGERDVNAITVRPEVVPRIKIGHPTMVDLAD